MHIREGSHVAGITVQSSITDPGNLIIGLAYRKLTATERTNYSIASTIHDVWVIVTGTRSTNFAAEDDIFVVIEPSFVADDFEARIESTQSL